MKMLWMSLVSSFLLSACMVGPDYSRPEYELGQRYRSPVTLGEAQSIADLPWLNFFADEDLQRIVAVALRNNLDLQLAFARIEEARARVSISRSAFGPSFSGVISNSPSPGNPGENDATYTGGLVVGWELDVFGKLRRMNEASRAAMLATEEGSRAVMSSLVAAVAGSWYRLRELDEEVAIIKRNIAIQESSLDLVRALMDSGVASEAEEQQAIAQLAATRARLPLAQQQVAIVEHGLSVLLDRPPRSMPVRQPLNEGVSSPRLAGLAVGLPIELLDRRPDIRQAEYLLHGATAQIGVAVANRFPFPTIGLSGVFGRLAVDVDDLFSSGNSVDINAWGPSINLQILDFGAAKGNVDVAKARTRQALISYRATVLKALQEVADALHRYESAGAIIEQSEVFANAARESVRLQQLRFRSGVVSYIQVLDAERQLLAAEVNLAQARLARILAYIDIYRSLGGGWSDAELRRLQSASTHP